MAHPHKQPRLALVVGITIGVTVAAVTWRTMVHTDNDDRAASAAPENDQRPIANPDFGYVGSDACRSCHEHNHLTWHASYHRTMTQVPVPGNVVADFDNVDLEVDGKKFRLRQRNEKYFVELDDPEWSVPTQYVRQVTREIVLMTGSHHEQDFWFETPYGRKIQRLPFVYRIPEKRWIPDSSVLLTPPNSPSGFGDWNVICIRCHTTLGRPRLQPELGLVETDVVEFGISCEACHGPGESHVRRFQANGESTRDRSEIPINQNDQIVNPSKLEHQRSAQVCGQCHGLHEHRTDEDVASWNMNGLRFRPGEDLNDSLSVVRVALAKRDPTLRQHLVEDPHLLEDRFWPDGMVRVTGREYNGLIESPCFQRGELTCLSCHTMHPSADDPRPLKEWANDQLQLGMYSNKACLQCHPEIGGSLKEHTHHATDSVGSRCYNCHMPPTTYGLLKAVHSHQINSPNLTDSLVAGRPNACNLCHLDKTLEWTSGYLASWYGIERQKLSQDQSDVPISILLALKGDAGQRAIIAWAMGWRPAQEASGKDWQGRLLSPLLADPYDAVRFIAYRSLRTLPGFQEFKYDFIGDPPRRKAKSIESMARWVNGRKSAGQSTDLGELINAPADSSPDALLSRLLKQRNDRPVQLAE